MLPPNAARTTALAELPDDAAVFVFIAAQKDHQTCPTLLKGTAAKGRLGFGDQTGTRRLKAGDCVLRLGVIGEAFVCADILDSQLTEILILSRWLKPIEDFRC